MSDEQVWLERAVDLATASVARGGGPFGAVVVRDAVVIGEGTNRVTAGQDTPVGTSGCFMWWTTCRSENTMVHQVKHQGVGARWLTR